jgi:putative transposase
VRKRVAYENPTGRRVNVLAAVIPEGAARALTWERHRGSITADQFLAFVATIPHPADRPLVVVLDNGSSHVSKLVRQARAALRQQGVHLYYLPPYSPELNRIEPVFKAIKHYDLPERRYPTWETLEAAIDAAFARYHARLHESAHQPRKAA